jgi:outer membrane protein
LEETVSASMPTKLLPDYTLTGAVQVALKNFPTIRAAERRKESQDASVSLAKTTYLPHLDVLWQGLRATQNVTAGAVLPQTIDVIPLQSGPFTTSSSFNSIWENNAGVALAWEIYDFGQRHAKVDVARADVRQARAITKLTELDVAFAVSDAYLTTVAAREAIRANKASLDRYKAWSLVVHTLVDKGLRAGIDSARADAEVSLSKIAVIDTERDTELARADLAEAMGEADSYVGILPGPMIHRPKSVFQLRTAVLENHPLSVVKAAAVDSAAARVHVLDRTWYPHVWFHSAMWGRGSGFSLDPRNIAGGILPQSANWVAGFSVSFPAFDIFAIRAERRMLYKSELAQRADYDLALQELGRKDARARILVEKAQQVAEETPVLVFAARENEIKSRERYRVGLCDVVEVAEAERILANAEVRDALAQVAVWRSILQASYVQGDLRPFLTLVAEAEADSSYK